MRRIPHKANIPGDFYVEDDCCTACGLVEAEAPDFFKYFESENEYYPGEKSYHCYFCKQPQNEAEVKLVVKAMLVQEVDCVRYKGEDSVVLNIMEQEGVLQYSDANETMINTSTRYAMTKEKPKTALEKILGWFKI